jgi:filamentous hemagglutinin family protein
MKIKKYFSGFVRLKNFRRDSSLCRAVALLAAASFTFNALANPTGMTVQSGHATLSLNGSQLTINAGNNAVLNWQSFNIGTGETTTFNQPNAGSIVWNRIGGQSASQIYGSLQANGVVILLNSSGFYFGPNSFVSAAGLVVSTANCMPPQNGGGSWEFNGPPPLASIVNYGQIKIGNGGDCFLIADKIENHGDIEAPGGNIGLAAGQTVTLSERPDGRGMSMNVVLPQGSVDNCGNLIADGGTIALNAKVVNQNGLIQANSVQEQNGVIELVASDSLNLGANSQITAQGDASASGSAGGNVTLQSGNTFSDASGSSIVTAGGVNGGNGGNVEISAPQMATLNTRLDGTAHNGFKGGELLLDPDYIILDTSGGDSAGGGAVAVNDDPGGTLDLNVNSAFTGFSQITLQAKYDIQLADDTAWNLSASTGLTAGQLNLEAGRNIILGNAASIYDANAWNIALYAGVTDFATATVAPINPSSTTRKDGSISLNSNDPFSPTYIQTASGSINLVAAKNITLGAAFVNTTAGGSISAHALSGNINTGTDAQGYYMDTSGASTSLNEAYNLSDGLGGISTGAGGNVTLIAGGNVTSYLPGSGSSGDALTAGSGAFGNQPGQLGNVTVVAGGNVTGNYMVADGTGSIFTGVSMDANGNPVQNTSGNYVLGGVGSAGTSATKPNLALSLIAGGWNVTSAKNIYLQEVRNPNGYFDTSAGAAYDHYFDYAPGAYVNLSAGNLVQLGAPSSTLPRQGGDGLTVPSIYPSILDITAGVGGIVLGTPGSSGNLILFPSPLGSLVINDQGSLVSGLSANPLTPQIFNLIVSDSGQSQYKSSSTFGLNDHASTPVHLDSEDPFTVNVAGDMNLVLLGAPEAAQIQVGGNMNNCRFQGMNLSAGDVTSINVAGDINNRSAFTSVVLNLSPATGEQAPDLSYLARSLSSNPSGTTLANSFYYNPVTHVLTYQNIPNQSLASALQLLQNLTVQKVDANGNLLWLDSLDTIPATETVSAINSATAAALLNQYNALGGIPQNASSSGLVIGGGGKFNITARSIDLGTSAGIQSKGAGLYRTASGYPLASLFGNGGVFARAADINVTTTGNHSEGQTANGDLVGDLDMFSSSIASLSDGNISIYSSGDINAGSPDFTVTATTARGIFNTGQGDVNVLAAGDINVNGSRIAAYDGGNVTVESLDGNISAGSGGSGYVIVNSYTVDPVTHGVQLYNATIPGSGILTTTFPSDPDRTIGNILVEAPNGNINASQGGIVQLPLNQTKSPDAIVQLLAGLELQDVNGNVLTAGAINQPTIQGKTIAATAGDPPNTVVIADGVTPIKIQVSSAVLSKLATILNLAPTAGQDLELSLLGGDTTALKNVLAGNGSGLANYNYAAFASANQSIDASGSGVIGSNVKLAATGDILGVIFARNNISLTAQQNVNVTALAQGTVSANAGGALTGTLIGIGGISASGGSVDASLESNSTISGDTSGSKGIAQGTAANATSSAMASDDSVNSTKTTDNTAGDDLKKKKGIALAQKVSRVTVLLPANKLSEKSATDNPL